MGSNFPFPIDLRRRPYKHSCTTVRMWLNYQRPADVNAIYTFLRHIPVLLWLLLLVTSTIVNIAIHLTINVDKTKVMATWKKTNSIWVINNEKLQQVETFKYLGALITDDAECARDIRAILGNGTGTLKSMQRLWQSHDISIDTKVRLLQTIVWSAATYGCEGWTLKKSDESRIEAFEMKGLR